MRSVRGYLRVPCFLCQSDKRLWLIDAIFVHSVEKLSYYRSPCLYLDSMYIVALQVDKVLG